MLKNLLIILTLFIFSACSSGSEKEKDKADKSVLKDSVTYQRTGNSGIEKDFSNKGDTLVSAVQEKIAGLLDSLRQTAYSYSTVELVYNGYENGHETTWYFDSKQKLICCQGSWDSEGLSGKYTQFFRNDSLLALMEENSYHTSEETIALHTDFMPVYGFTRTIENSDGGQDVESTTYASDKEYQKKKDDAWGDYHGLVSRIRELRDKAVFNGDDVTITSEEIVNYGDDFTQKEEYKLDRQLFNKFIKSNNL